MKKLGIFISILWGLMACTISPYEEGEGRYSFLQSHLVMAKTAQAGSLVSALTDQDSVLIFTETLPCSWATTPDSTYRALLYYQQKGNNIRAITAERVYVLSPTAQDSVIKTHPLKLESIWLSPHKQFLNLRVALKSGEQNNANERHTLAIIQTHSTLEADGTTHFQWVLYHDQHQIPQFVSTSVFLSIPTNTMKKGDKVTITIPDYAQTLTKEFEF